MLLLRLRSSNRNWSILVTQLSMLTLLFAVCRNSLECLVRVCRYYWYYVLLIFCSSRREKSSGGHL